MTQAALPDAVALALADARVPRYTSYPTAAGFAAMEEPTWRSWLAEGIRADDALSLYVHVPFCRDLCWYCGCHTRATRSSARVESYAAGLHAELGLLQDALPEHGGLSHVHFGGGTPSTLGAEGLTALVVALRRRFGFRAMAEIAIELDPRHVDSALAEALADAGFNRVSFGVQDIAPEVQAAIGRIQPAASVAAAVSAVRGVGIAAVNIDVMYGLPRQTEAHVASTARFVAGLGADRVAVFGYAHVPWMKPHQRAIATETLPGAGERLRQAATAEAVLLGEGYATVGLDHFARPNDPLALSARAGTLRRNFQGYTTDVAPALLGLGASSIGHLPAGMGQSDPDERRWLAAIREGRLPIVRGRATTPEERLRWRMIERVMCDMALDLRPARWGVGSCGVLHEAKRALRPLAEAGVVTLGADRVDVTAAGRRFVRQVAACFDADLAGTAGRHSVAV